ncbi:PstS family phosphate ABC transporter substrate-binding protein [Dinghuibacter silviterrae]|nr:substrate-binding domain-containing protein [Dinghuibacter silviterrae]
MVSCKQQGGEAGLEKPADSLSAGRINISVDESFRPVMEEELKVFRSSNPRADIRVSYKPEAECLKDLQQDSVRMVFVTRELTQEEEAYYKDRLKYDPVYEVLAYDAVAVLVNRTAPDSVFTREEVADILRGKGGKMAYTPVFDGLNATSTIRFAMDSILKGGAFDPGHVFAASNSTGVIEYVASHPDAMGFVGVDWIGNPEDTLQAGYRDRVRITAIRCDECPGKPYVAPTQEKILTKSYPFTRGLYYIKKENYDGLGTGFVDFLKYQRGQLIFRRAYLVPAIMAFIVRDAKVQ